MDLRIRAACPGGWRENLSPEEQDVLNEALMPTLAQFGLEERTAVGHGAR